MQRFSPILALVVGLTLALPVDAGRSNVQPLHTGDTFPRISGQTLTGKSLILPATGKPAVLVFSFSRVAAKDSRLWNQHLANDFRNAIPTYTIILLESAPKLFRGMAISGIKSSMPLTVQDRVIVLYTDEKLWMQRLGVANASRAYVLLLGPRGHIQWRNSGAFSDVEYAHLKSSLSAPVQLHP